MKEKIAYSEPLKNTRDLVNFLNAQRIPKEDIVTILDKGEQLLLIYYS